MTHPLYNFYFHVFLAQNCCGIFRQLYSNNNRICLSKNYVHLLQFANAIFYVIADGRPSRLLPMDRSVPNG